MTEQVQPPTFLGLYYLPNTYYPLKFKHANVPAAFDSARGVVHAPSSEGYIVLRPGGVYHSVMPEDLCKLVSDETRGIPPQEEHTYPSWSILPTGTLGEVALDASGDPLEMMTVAETPCSIKLPLANPTPPGLYLGSAGISRGTVHVTYYDPSHKANTSLEMEVTEEMAALAGNAGALEYFVEFVPKSIRLLSREQGFVWRMAATVNTRSCELFNARRVKSLVLDEPYWQLDDYPAQDFEKEFSDVRNAIVTLITQTPSPSVIPNADLPLPPAMHHGEHGLIAPTESHLQQTALARRGASGLFEARDGTVTYDEKPDRFEAIEGLSRHSLVNIVTDEYGPAPESFLDVILIACHLNMGPEYFLHSLLARLRCIPPPSSAHFDDFYQKWRRFVRLRCAALFARWLVHYLSMPIPSVSLENILCEFEFSRIDECWKQEREVGRFLRGLYDAVSCRLWTVRRGATLRWNLTEVDDGVDMCRIDLDLFARCLTHVHGAQFCRLTRRALLDLTNEEKRPEAGSFVAKLGDVKSSPSILPFPMLAPQCCLSQLVQWVATTVCKQIRLKERVRVIERLIRLGKTLYELGNYHGVSGITAGLSMAPVTRLRRTWGQVDPSRIRFLRELEAFVAKTGGYEDYQIQVGRRRASRPLPVAEGGGATLLEADRRRTGVLGLRDLYLPIIDYIRNRLQEASTTEQPRMPPHQILLTLHKSRKLESYLRPFTALQSHWRLYLRRPEGTLSPSLRVVPKPFEHVAPPATEVERFAESLNGVTAEVLSELSESCEEPVVMKSAPALLTRPEVDHKETGPSHTQVGPAVKASRSQEDQNVPYSTEASSRGSPTSVAPSPRESPAC